jgi:hypothetical protein
MSAWWGAWAICSAVAAHARPTRPYAVTAWKQVTILKPAGLANELPNFSIIAVVSDEQMPAATLQEAGFILVDLVEHSSDRLKGGLRGLFRLLLVKRLQVYPIARALPGERRQCFQTAISELLSTICVLICFP